MMIYRKLWHYYKLASRHLFFWKVFHKNFHSIIIVLLLLPVSVLCRAPTARPNNNDSLQKFLSGNRLSVGPTRMVHHRFAHRYIRIGNTAIDIRNTPSCPRIIINRINTATDLLTNIHLRLRGNRLRGDRLRLIYHLVIHRTRLTRRCRDLVYISR